MNFTFLGLILVLAGCSWMSGPSAQTSPHTAPPPPAPASQAYIQSGVQPSSHSVADIADVQQKLTEDGDYHGPMDGKFGTATASALRAYQASHNLTVTGIVDDATREKMGL